MEKYKLIKAYPGSPRLGLEIHKNGIYWSSDFLNKRNIEYFWKCDSDFSPTDHPEYWEKVVEKEYDFELLKVEGLHQSNKGIFTIHGKEISFKSESGRIVFSHYNYKSYSDIIDEFIKHKAITKILSVKRKSDGVIYSVGDYISRDCKVEGFTIIDNTIIVKISNCVNDMYLQNLLCPMKVVYITDDGFPLFMGDKYYFTFCNSSNSFLSKTIYESGYITSEKGFIRDGTTFRFYKKENAEAFVKKKKEELFVSIVRNTLYKTGEITKHIKNDDINASDLPEWDLSTRKLWKKGVQTFTVNISKWIHTDEPKKPMVNMIRTEDNQYAGVGATVYGVSLTDNSIYEYVITKADITGGGLKKNRAWYFYKTNATHHLIMDRKHLSFREVNNILAKYPKDTDFYKQMIELYNLSKEKTK